jgi:uncharacterized protein YlxW (UPF0749 family)
MDPHERLSRAAQLLCEYESLQRRLQSKTQILQTAQENQKLLEKQMLSEGKDLEKLDGISLLNLWHSIRSSKDLAREKEMQEYLAAKMKYEEATANVQMLENDIRRIENKLQSLGNSVEEYQEALKAKENYLLKSGNLAIQRILDLDEKLGRLRAEKLEIQEAIDVGQSANSGLARIAEILKSASGWGAVDILGGGLIITAIKHSRINDAKRELQKTQALLQRFQRELDDGRRVLFMGGAQSIDRYRRYEGWDWFPEEIICEQELSYLPEGKVDIVVSHTCPLEFPMENFCRLRSPAIDPSRQYLSRILNKYQPAQWYFGHWHIHAQGQHGSTRWEALSWSMQWSHWYRVLP